VISKEEMFHTLRVLGDSPADYVAEKGKMPDKIENLFSLMDFAHDGKISEEEFLRATGHYRRLGQLLIIEKWEHFRNGKHLVPDQMNNGGRFLEIVRSLAWDLTEWNLKQDKAEGGQEITEEPPKPDKDENKEETKGILKIKKGLSFDKH
jgi:hypothetical protein